MSQVKVYLRNADSGKGQWLDLSKFDNFDSLAKAAEKIGGNGDWEFVDVEAPEGFAKHANSLQAAYALSKLVNEGASPVATSLVVSYHGEDILDEAAKDAAKMQDLVDRCLSVVHTPSKADFVLEQINEQYGKLPGDLEGYIDTDMYFQDHYDINLDGSWDETSDGIYIYFA
jgi:hypothetical protein